MKVESLFVFAPELKTSVIVFAFIIADIATGLIKAISTHSYSSSIMREGLFHKLGEIVCLIFGVLCDYTLPMIGIKIPLSIAQSVSIYIIIMEIGSVIENIGVLNPELSKYLGKIFEKIETPDNEKGDDIEK